MQSNGGPEPNLNDGFDEGGWQVRYFDDDMTRLMTGRIATADGFLMGRRTYEGFAGIGRKSRIRATPWQQG